MNRRQFLRTGVTGIAATTGILAAGTGSAAAAYDGWFDDVDSYDGTHDYRGDDEVRVAVGGGEMGLTYEPAAILIDPGTTVIWEWTGEGGDHDVSAVDGTFQSELVGAAGHTFEHTFDDAAEGDIFGYVCTPHEPVGMKGAVAVGDIDDTLVSTDGGAGASDAAGGRELSSADQGALALALAFVGALLIPLFYAGHKKANATRQSG